MSKIGQEFEKRLDANKYEVYKQLKDALQEICRLCVRLNPQHKDCTSCEDMEERRKVLAKVEGK